MIGLDPGGMRILIADDHEVVRLGLKALIERRNEILRDAFAQWQGAMKDVASPEAFSKQAEAAKQNVEKAMANFRELAQLEAQARTNAWKVLQDRMQENLANLQKLLMPK